MKQHIEVMLNAQVEGMRTEQELLKEQIESNRIQVFDIIL